MSLHRSARDVQWKRVQCPFIDAFSRRSAATGSPCWWVVKHSISTLHSTYVDVSIDWGIGMISARLWSTWCTGRSWLRNRSSLKKHTGYATLDSMCSVMDHTRSWRCTLWRTGPSSCSRILKNQRSVLSLTVWTTWYVTLNVLTTWSKGFHRLARVS